MMSSTPFTYRPRGSVHRRGVLASNSSRIAPYPPPENVLSRSTSSTTTGSQDELGAPDLVPHHDQDLGIMVQRCYMAVQANSRQLQQLKETVSNIARQVGTILTKLNETDKERFNLKDAHLEKPLRVEIAKAYVTSLTRQLNDQRLAEIIQKVLPGDAISEKYKCDLVSSRCKELMTTFRAEERRRIFGRPPCVNAKHKTTCSLSDDLMKYFNAPFSLKEMYVKHLAILRLYIQLVPDSEHSNSFFAGFRKWLADTYSSGVPTEEDYVDLMTHDEDHDYIMYPTMPSESELRQMTEQEEQLETTIVNEATDN